jgi:DNA-binding LacI/PurR family transcriptional regulator
MDREIRNLFGRPVFISDPDLTLTDQIYEILCEEIRSGHWQVGERLPSVIALSNQTGLGRTPIQQAFERLGEAGYVRQEQRSGTFLECQFPDGEKSLGAIGVALHLSEEEGNLITDAYSHFRLAHLLKAIAERGYVPEVHYLRSQEEWNNVDSVGKVFGEHVEGIVALHPCDHESVPNLRPGKLPFVYLGSVSRRCQPVVAGDTSKGFYDATAKLIALDHRNIACFMDPSESREENAVRMEAHEAAMFEAGLAVMRQAAIDSYKVNSDDLFALRHWLDTYAAATALICMRGSANVPLVNVARLIGRAVPENLSLIGHGEHPGRPDLPVTRVDYDYASLLSACLDLLTEQMRTRRVTVSRLLIRAYIREGATVARCIQQSRASLGS